MTTVKDMSTVKDTTFSLSEEAVKALDNTAALLESLKSDAGEKPGKKSPKKPASGKTPEKEDTSLKPAATVREYKTRIKGEETAPAPAQEEDTAVAMSTDAFSKEVLTEFHKRTKAIRNSIGKIDSSFGTIAFNLYWIYARQAYKSEGYDTIAAYAADSFGYQKSTCYSLISVVERFARTDEKGLLMEAFDDRVKGFSISKLSLMVGLTDEDIASLNPSMSIRDIRRFVRGLQAKALPELSEGDPEPPEEVGSIPEENGVTGAGSVTVPGILIRCVSQTDYENKMELINKDIRRVYSQYPGAVISVSFTVPEDAGKKG